eukprot:g12310.t1
MGTETILSMIRAWKVIAFGFHLSAAARFCPYLALFTYQPVAESSPVSGRNSLNAPASQFQFRLLILRLLLTKF